MTRPTPLAVALLLAAAAVSAPVHAETARSADDERIARGRYLVTISGCNDCHTAGFAQSDGATPESQWLTGDHVGFQGPWGTSYPANLRLRLAELDAQQWLSRARAPMRPPMPWFNLAAMTDEDLLAIYRYVRHLGPAGTPAPAAAAPGVRVATPYIEFYPKNLPQQHAQATP